MSGSDELYARIDEAEQAMRSAEDNLRSFQTLAPTLAELTGRGEAGEGLVVVEWGAAGMLSLELDPKAMRLPSADLASEITEAVGSAMADLRTKTRAALDAAGVAGAPRLTPEQVREKLAGLRRMTTDGARRAAADFDRAEQLRRNGDGRR